MTSVLVLNAMPSKEQSQLTYKILHSIPPVL